MKTFIIKILSFAFIFFLFDKTFLILTNYLPKLEVDKKLELLLTGKINKDIVIIGSSRGARDIIASKIAEYTGQSAFNLSYPGSDIEFHEFILRTLIKYNKYPKTILLAVDDNAELLPNESIKFRLDRLFPLVKYSHIRQELINRGEKNEYIAKVLVLHFLDMNNFNLRQKKFTTVDTILDCGSMPISSQSKNKNLKFQSIESTYPVDLEDSKKIKAFKNFVSLCRTHKIRLVIVFPPNFYAPNRAFENRLMQLAGKQINFFTYNNKNPLYYDKNYFYDSSHLLRHGAELLTGEIVSYLNNKHRTKTTSMH